MVNNAYNRRAIVAFILILAFFLFLADYLVVSHQHNHSLEEFKHHSITEVSILGSLIRESLTRNDYTNVERFIDEWGTDNPEILAISVIINNNFVLANYQRSNQASEHIFPVERSFSYANDKSFTINLIKDSSHVLDQISKLTIQLVLSSVIFVLFLGFLMWKTLEVTAIKPLQKEINERLKTEEQLKIARDEALEASMHKSEFLANMSHELRTPLNSIIGFTSIVKEGLAGPVNKEQKKQLGLVYTSSEHLLELINGILNLSKVEAGEYEPIKTYFNFQSLLEELRETLKPLADNKQLALEVMVNCVTDEIYTDRNMLSQILINLLSNAIKFTERGSITLDCENINDKLILKVIDTGIGISSNNLDEIFDSFKQIDSGTARKYEGTGLGLSICKHFTDLLNGKLDVESEEGKGTTFTLTLPLNPE